MPKADAPLRHTCFEMPDEPQELTVTFLQGQNERLMARIEELHHVCTMERQTIRDLRKRLETLQGLTCCIVRQQAPGMALCISDLDVDRLDCRLVTKHDLEHRETLVWLEEKP